VACVEVTVPVLPVLPWGGVFTGLAFIGLAGAPGTVALVFPCAGAFTGTAGVLGPLAPVAPVLPGAGAGTVSTGALALPAPVPPLLPFSGVVDPPAVVGALLPAVLEPALNAVFVFGCAWTAGGVMRPRPEVVWPAGVACAPTVAVASAWEGCPPPRPPPLPRPAPPGLDSFAA
jgi:hypothetical protein